MTTPAGEPGGPPVRSGDYPVLPPHKAYLLVNGADPRPGEKISRLVLAGSLDTDGLRTKTAAWQHSSSRALVLSLCSAMRTQGRVTADEAFTLLMGSVGGSWLWWQDDPRKMFDTLWAMAFVHTPAVSFEALVRLLLQRCESDAAPSQEQLLAVAKAVGWGNRGNVGSLLNGLVGAGHLRREEARHERSGKSAGFRFWYVDARTPDEVAVAVRKTCYLALRGRADQALHRVALGPEEGGKKSGEADGSYESLLTSSRLRERGLRVVQAEGRARRGQGRAWSRRRGDDTTARVEIPASLSDGEMAELMGDEGGTFAVQVERTVTEQLGPPVGF